MAGAQCVEVLCAALLEGQGKDRWQTCRLTVSAVARAEKIEVISSMSDMSNNNRWSFSSRPQTEAEAVAQVKEIVEHPTDAFERGKFSGIQEQRDAFKALFTGLKIQFFVDTTQGESDLRGNPITVGMGRYLATQVENEAELTPELSAGITRYFAEAPFIYGYWAPYKRLVKLLEAKPDAVTLLPVALARIDGKMLRIAKAQANDQLRQFDATAPISIASSETVAYLMRRGRRWLRRLARNDQTAYVRFATALLKATDAQGSNVEIASRWILADILYGHGALDTMHGRGELWLPSGQSLYNRRLDRFPKAWNDNIKAVCGIWGATVNNPDIQIWAFNVLKSQHQNLPLLRTAGLRLALVSPSKLLRAHACKQVAEKPNAILSLDAAMVQVFLEYSSAKQFSDVYPTLEDHSGAKPIQDAVLAFINEHGMPEICRGAAPTMKDKRPAKLLCFSLRFMRSRFNTVDTYHLARYVGQATQFKPVMHWVDTFQSLPLKTLIELRLHLPNLPGNVVRLIDRACWDTIAKGEGDENIAAALPLSPAPDLRKLGWSLLAKANDSTIATVWTTLIANVESSKGLEMLLEGVRFKEHLERIVFHPLGAQLLTSLVTALALAAPRVAEGLLLRLTAKGDSQRTLDTLGSAITSTPEEGWARRPALLLKLIALDPALTQLVWGSVEGKMVPAIAEIHLATRHLASAMIDAIDVDEIQKIGANRANYLTQALRSSPLRLYQDQRFAVSCATCPHPGLQQFAIARLEARGLLDSVFIPLAESGMPAAVAAAERFIVSIKDRFDFTKAVIALCDSGVRVTRAIGLGLIERQPDRLDLNGLLVALAEHTSPDVSAIVALYAATGIIFKRGVLENFDNRVLKTRRTGRKAKELVKSRLGLSKPEPAILISTQPKANELRVQALFDMARGSSLRDRDWALQQLTSLALDGHPIPQIQISLTS